MVGNGGDIRRFFLPSSSVGAGKVEEEEEKKKDEDVVVVIASDDNDGQEEEEEEEEKKKETTTRRKKRSGGEALEQFARNRDEEFKKRHCAEFEEEQRAGRDVLPATPHQPEPEAAMTRKTRENRFTIDRLHTYDETDADAEALDTLENDQAAIRTDDLGVIVFPNPAKLTPLEQQIVHLKKHLLPRAIDVLAVEVGYKYRFFGDCAVRVSKAMTNLGVWRDRSFMTCSVPTHTIETYVRRLCKVGYKVGVVRQVKRGEEKKKHDDDDDVLHRHGRGMERHLNCSDDGFLAGAPKDPFLRRLVGLFTAATIGAGMRSLALAETTVTNARDIAATTSQPKPKYNPFLKRFVMPPTAGGAGGGGSGSPSGSKADDDALATRNDDAISNHLLCVVESGEAKGAEVHIGIVAVDASTGDLVWDTFLDDSLRSRFDGICSSLSPVEILVPKARLSHATHALINEYKANAQREGRTVRISTGDAHTSSTLPSSSTGTSSHKALPKLVCTALDHLRSYLSEFGLQHALDQRQRHRQYTREAQRMKINANALRQLEIVGTGAASSSLGTSTTSLLGLLDHTRTVMGSRVLRQWIVQPLIRRTDVLNRQALIARIVSAWSQLPESEDKTSADSEVNAMLRNLPTLLKSIRAVDLDRSLLKTLNGSITPRDFVRLISSVCTFAEKLRPAATVHNVLLEASSDIRTGDVQTESDCLLGSLLSRITNHSLPSTANGILQFLDVDSARANDLRGIFLKSKHDGVKSRFREVFDAKARFDAVSAELDALLKTLHEDLRNAQKTKRSIPALSWKHMTDNEYLIELSATSALTVPSNWQLVNSTKAKKRFRPRSVTALYDQLLDRQKDIDASAHMCFSRVLDIVCGRVRDETTHGDNSSSSNSLYTLLENAAAGIREADAITSLALVSFREGYTRPQILIDERLDGDDDISIEIRGGKHPILETRMASSFIANDTRLCNNGTAAPSCLLITGPNMAGKSVYIKQTALLVLMAQLGMFVPAQSLVMTTKNNMLFDAIYTRIGANDRLSVGSSTFLEELTETSLIIRESTRKSLVVLDELGRGTSTHDGLAIAHSTLDYFSRVKMSCMLFVTHYHDLAAASQSRPRTEDTDAETGGAVQPMYMAYSHRGRSDHETDDDNKLQEITFLYKLVSGICPFSFGLNVAKMSGVPGRVLESAYYRSDSMARESREQRTRQEHLRTIRKLISFAAAGNADRILEIVRTL